MLDLSHDAYLANNAGPYLETIQKSVDLKYHDRCKKTVISHLPSNGKHEFDAF